MTLRRLKFFLALIAALLLPVHAMASANMMISQFGNSTPEVMQVSVSEADKGTGCDMAEHQAEPSDAGKHCSSCGVCYLAGAGLIVSTIVLADIVRVSGGSPTMPVSSYPSRTIEPLTKPPRAS